MKRGSELLFNYFLGELLAVNC